MSFALNFDRTLVGKVAVYVGREIGFDHIKATDFMTVAEY